VQAPAIRFEPLENQVRSPGVLLKLKLAAGESPGVRERRIGLPAECIDDAAGTREDVRGARVVPLWFLLEAQDVAEAVQLLEQEEDPVLLGPPTRRRTESAPEQQRADCAWRLPGGGRNVGGHAVGVDCTMGAPVASLALESIGAFTSAGPSTAQTMAALCLRVSLFEELPSRDAQGEPVIGALSALPLDKAEGLDRLTTLATLALEECGGDPRDGRPLPLLLCAPEPGDALPDPAALLRAIVSEAPVAIEERASAVFAGGRIGLFPALRAATRLIAEGGFAGCYIGGVDSLVDYVALDIALRAGLVKTGPTPEGFVPGEGAVFLRVAARAGSGTLRTIAGVGEAQDPAPRGSSEPNSGTGYTRAAHAALAEARVGVPAIGLVVHDAAGDRFGFRDAGFAISRLSPRPDPVPTIWMPATVAGEMGAAYGPLAIAQAAFFLQKQVSPGPAALVLGAAKGAGRGAAVLIDPSAR
jgi:3-oxoacyl-[acyl-carrier-protein] synthase I